MTRDRDNDVAAHTTRRYELVVPVELPDGMTPDEFLGDVWIEWRRGDGGRNQGAFRQGPDLDKMPSFHGPKELRNVVA